MEQKTLYCCQCRDDIIPRLTTGKETHPKRKKLWKRFFWICDKCGNFVGSYKETRNPLGVIGTRKNKEYRQRIHRKLDQLWKHGLCDRQQVYERMSIELGIEEFHVGNIRSPKEGKEILKIAKRLVEEILHYEQLHIDSTN